MGRINDSSSLLPLILTVCVLFSSEKKREFYDNAKHVKKYKKLVKQQQTDVPLAIKALEV